MRKRKVLLIILICVLALLATAFAIWAWTPRPIHLAAQIGSVRQLRRCLRRGVDVNLMDDSGVTPLHLAVGYGHLDVAEYLLSNGANVNATLSTDGTVHSAYHLTTPLIAATASRFFDARMVELLLQHGAQVNHIDTTGKSALFYAVCKTHNIEAATLLLEHKAEFIGFDNFALGLLFDDLIADPQQHGLLKLVVEKGVFDNLSQRNECLDYCMSAVLQTWRDDRDDLADPYLDVDQSTLAWGQKRLNGSADLIGLLYSQGVPIDRLNRKDQLILKDYAKYSERNDILDALRED